MISLYSKSFCSSPPKSDFEYLNYVHRVFISFTVLSIILFSIYRKFDEKFFLDVLKRTINRNLIKNMPLEKLPIKIQKSNNTIQYSAIFHSVQDFNCLHVVDLNLN